MTISEVYNLLSLTAPKDAEIERMESRYDLSGEIIIIRTIELYRNTYPVRHNIIISERKEGLIATTSYTDNLPKWFTAIFDAERNTKKSIVFSIKPKEPKE